MKRKPILFTLLALVIVAGGAAVFSQMQRGDSKGIASAADSTQGDSTSQADKKDKKNKDKPEDKPVPVETALATARDIPSHFSATGSLEARRQVELISKAQGQIIKLNVEEGDFVKKGAVLLEIEHREEELLLDKARTSAERALKDLERSKELLEKGLDSNTNYELKKELAETSVIEKDLAQVRLDNKIVRAPFDGLVTLRSVELGQTVNPGMPLLGLADVNPMEVRLFLPEQVVQDLRIGQPVEVRPDVADAPIHGTVDRIAPAVDPATSTIKVTLSVDNAEGAARVGSFVRARVTTDVHTDCIAIPKKALVAEAGVTYVYVAEADTVRRVSVVTGYADDDFAEITDGIHKGERVVTVGQGGLRTGSKIRDLSSPAADPGSVAGADTAAKNGD